jgi:hypothetical protein
MARRWRIALGADERSTFRDTTQGFAKVSGTTEEGDSEWPFVNVVGLVGWSENLALIDEVHSEGLEYLCLGEVANACLGHDKDRDGSLDSLDEGRVTHAGNSTVTANVSRHTLKGHDRYGAGVLGKASLVSSDYVHNHTTTEELCQTAFEGLGAVLVGGLAGGLIHRGSV